jgi:hypothetical protein
VLIGNRKYIHLLYKCIYFHDLSLTHPIICATPLKIVEVFKPQFVDTLAHYSGFSFHGSENCGSGLKILEKKREESRFWF